MYIRETNLLTLMLLFFPFASLQAFILTSEKESASFKNKNKLALEVSQLENISSFEKSEGKCIHSSLKQSKEVDDSLTLLNEHPSHPKSIDVSKEYSTVTYYWSHRPEVPCKLELTNAIDERDRNFLLKKLKWVERGETKRKNLWGSEEVQKKWISEEKELIVSEKVEKKKKRQMITKKFGAKELTYSIWLNLLESKDTIRSLSIGYLATKDENGKYEHRFPTQYQRLLISNSLARKHLTCPIRSSMILSALGIVGVEIFLIINSIPKYTQGKKDMTVAAIDVGFFGFPTAAALLLWSWDPSCFKICAWKNPNRSRKIILKQKPARCLELFCCPKKVEEFSKKTKIRPRYDLCFGIFRWPYCYQESCSSRFLSNCLRGVSAFFRRCCRKKKLPLIKLRIEKNEEEKDTITLEIPIGEKAEVPE